MGHLGLPLLWGASPGSLLRVIGLLAFIGPVAGSVVGPMKSTLTVGPNVLIAFGEVAVVCTPGVWPMGSLKLEIEGRPRLER